MRLVVRCPAKINTFLSVGPPEKRGYHPLRTTFQAVGLYDTLTVETSDRDSFECDSVEVPPDNTVTKALRMVRELAPIPPLRIVLEKRIPTRAGLGGGSSDAAGLLRAAARISQGINLADLASVALAVGADVPFFLVGGRARGEGYGERLTPLADLQIQWLVLAMPNVECSTPEMFARLDEKPRVWREFDEEVIGLNDFESVAPPECLELIDQFRRTGALYAGLSGSGSAVYGFFRSEAEARGARIQAPRTWVVPTLSRPNSLSIR